MSGIGYEYELPGNFEFCGNETRDEFSFTLYCFDQFRAMSSCVHADLPAKDYFECDYQASIQVDIKPLSSFQNSDSIINQALQNRFPGQAVSWLTIDRPDGDFSVAEIQPQESEAAAWPTYLTVIPHGTNYIAVITAEISQSGEADKAWDAFETVAQSYEAVIGRPQ